MAVAEDEKVEKAERAEKAAARSEKAAKGGDGGAEGPSTVANVVGWLPRKVKELQAFLTEVRTELKKATWPSKKEVYATTIVVMATTVFFGFYLWGLDLALSRILSQVVLRAR
jgi:preprotein translocase subunit SecE